MCGTRRDGGSRRHTPRPDARAVACRAARRWWQHCSGLTLALQRMPVPCSQHPQRRWGLGPGWGCMPLRCTQTAASECMQPAHRRLCGRASVATMSVPVAAIPLDPSCSRDLMVWHRQAAGPCGPGRLRGRAPFCRRTASHARRSRSCSQREATASAAVGSAPHDVAHRCSDHGVSVGRPAVVVVRAVHDQEPAAGQALLSRRMPSRRPSRAPALHAARLQLQVGVRGVP